MRVVLIAATATCLFAMPALAASQITCSQIPEAQHFLETLKPGPNTAQAERHLELAKKARTNQECVRELGIVNYYAKRSAAADARGRNIHREAAPEPNAAPHAAPIEADRADMRAPAAMPPRHVQCADLMHEDRPGGTDYHGPAVPGCRKPL